MSDPSDATPDPTPPAPETDELIHPPQDPDAPGAYVDDEETLDVPEPNEPA